MGLESDLKNQLYNALQNRFSSDENETVGPSEAAPSRYDAVDLPFSPARTERPLERHPHSVKDLHEPEAEAPVPNLEALIAPSPLSFLSEATALPVDLSQPTGSFESRIADAVFGRRRAQELVESPSEALPGASSLPVASKATLPDSTNWMIDPYRLKSELSTVEALQDGIPWESGKDKKNEFDGTLAMRGVVSDEKLSDSLTPATVPSSLSPQAKHVQLESVKSGGSMADLSGYKDLSRAPMSFGDDDMPMSSVAQPQEAQQHQQQPSGFVTANLPMPQQHFIQQEVSFHEVDTEFSGNVKTLIRLVNELPDGVTKQTGAQIIRLTMEAMGISMEDVLSEAQSAQSEMLDAVRANIKKIEEYKTVIRKLETDIKYYQGKANELSEIIDLFILSNTSGQKSASPDDFSH